MITKEYNNQNTNLVSYDFVDFATGKAYKRFYGVMAANANILFPEIIRSDGGNATSAFPGASYNIAMSETTLTKKIDLTFGTTFSTPQIIEGKFIANGTVGGVAVTDTTYRYHKLTVEVYKNSTFLASGATTLLLETDTGAGVESSNEHCVDFDIPKTPFAVGDILYVNTEVWARQSPGDPGTSRIALGVSAEGKAETDTANRAIESTDTTKLEFLVPFNPDI